MIAVIPRTAFSSDAASSAFPNSKARSISPRIMAKIPYVGHDENVGHNAGKVFKIKRMVYRDTNSISDEQIVHAGK